MKYYRSITKFVSKKKEINARAGVQRAQSIKNLKEIPMDDIN
jgi:hypothetical protein